jgi:hypothetical protein
MPEVNASVGGEIAPVALPMDDLEEPTVEGVLHRMDRHYGMAITFHAMTTEIGALKMLRGETVSAYSSRIWDFIGMLKSVHPRQTTTEWVTEKMLDVFYDGLPDRLSGQIRYTRMREGVTYDELLDEARAVERKQQTRFNAATPAPAATGTPVKPTNPGYYRKPTTAPAVRAAHIPEPEEEGEGPPLGCLPDTEEENIEDPLTAMEDRLTSRLSVFMAAWQMKKDAARQTSTSAPGGPPNSRTGDAPLSRGVCFYCQEPGHQVRDCPAIAALTKVADSVKVAENAKAGAVLKGSRTPANDKSTTVASRAAQLELPESADQ